MYPAELIFIETLTVTVGTAVLEVASALFLLQLVKNRNTPVIKKDFKILFMIVNNVEGSSVGLKSATQGLITGFNMMY